MKLSLLILFVTIGYKSQDNLRMNGTYKVEFNKTYYQQDYTIRFADTIYYKTMPDGERIKGKIIYYRESIVLKDYFKNIATDKFQKPLSDIQIEFQKSKSDTIPFSTKHVSNLHLSINSGNLVKVTN